MQRIDPRQLFSQHEPPPHGWQRLQQRIERQPMRQFHLAGAFALLLLIAPMLLIIHSLPDQPAEGFSLQGVVANMDQPGLRLEVDGQWRDMPVESINGVLWVELEEW